MQDPLDSNIALRPLTPVFLLFAQHPSGIDDTERPVSDNLARGVRDDPLVARLAVRGGHGDQAVGVVGRCRASKEEMSDNESACGDRRLFL